MLVAAAVAEEEEVTRGLIAFQQGRWDIVFKAISKTACRQGVATPADAGSSGALARKTRPAVKAEGREQARWRGGAGPAHPHRMPIPIDKVAHLT